MHCICLPNCSTTTNAVTTQNINNLSKHGIELRIRKYPVAILLLEWMIECFQNLIRLV